MKPTTAELQTPDEPVDRITVQQDIGGPYPVYKRVTLLLWADGQVTWEPIDKWAVDRD